MDIAAIITNMLVHLPYPIDLPQLIGNVQAVIEEHAVDTLNEDLIRRIVLDSIDIMEYNEYDEDMMLLRTLDNEHIDFYWPEGISERS